MSPLDRSPEIAVVGGGAVGLTVALELARRGAHPALLERSPDLSSSCSAGSAGLLSPAHSTPLSTSGTLREGLKHLLRNDSPFAIRPRPELVPWMVRFALACRTDRVQAATALIRDLSITSLDLHMKLAEEGLDTGFTVRGAINAYATEAGFAAGVAEARSLAGAGIESQILDPDELVELEPAIAPGSLGGVYYPQEAHCEPERFVNAIAGAAVAAGATIHTGVELLDLRIEPSGAIRLDTTAGELRPRHVVLANGAAVARFGRPIGLYIPVQGAKGYHVDLAPGVADPLIPVYLQEARVIATPFDNRLRLAGTLELTGLDTTVDPLRVRATLDAGVRALKGIDPGRVIEVWRGIRPCTPDGLPIVGRSPRSADVVVVTGHAMKGLHLAPATAELVADLVEGLELDPRFAPFRPERFDHPLGGLNWSYRRRMEAAR